MPELPPVVTVSKLDAARRQLATAIELWFHDKDEVSIHALAYAAYEVIHTISKKRGRTQTLILDTAAVPDQFRKLFVSLVKKAPNFFKHADRDPDGTVEIQPLIAEIFFIFSILGLSTLKLPPNDYESAFSFWFNFNRPHLLTQEGRELIGKLFPVDAVTEVRNWPKSEFLKAFLEARSAISSANHLM